MLCGQQDHLGVVSQSAYFGLQILGPPNGKKGKAVKTVRKDNKKARKNTKVLATTSVTSAATATAANQPETPSNAQQPILCGNSAEISHPAEVSVSLTTTTVTPQHGNLQNIKTSPSIDLHNCDEVSYEKKDNIHGVSYTDENGLAGWTPVVGRKKKKHCHLPEMSAQISSRSSPWTYKSQ